MLKKINFSSQKIFMMVFCLLSVAGSRAAFAQDEGKDQAKKLFDAGRYEEAIPVFRELVRSKPADAGFNYYLGASLAEAGQFTEETRQALDKAKKEVPESWFYLGKYFHMQSDWKNALLHYERFKSEANRKSVQASSVDELIFMCRNMKNPFPPAKSVTEQNTEETSGKDQASQVLLSRIKEIPEPLRDSLIHFQVNAVVNYNKISQFKDPSSKEAFIRGWLTERELQEKMSRLSGLRAAYTTRIGAGKDSLAAEILKLEQETYQMNQQARDAYQEAGAKEAGYWDKVGALEVESFRKEVSRIQDSVKTANDEKKRKEEEGKRLVILQDTATLVTDTASVATPPTASPANEIVFKIQIGAYRNSPPEWVQKQFKKLAIIRRIDQRVDEKGVTVYTVGELKTYEDALQMQKQIRMEGMKNAYVAAYQNDKRISLEEAKKLTSK